MPRRTSEVAVEKHCSVASHIRRTSTIRARINRQHQLAAGDFLRRHLDGGDEACPAQCRGRGIADPADGADALLPGIGDRDIGEPLRHRVRQRLAVGSSEADGAQIDLDRRAVERARRGVVRLAGIDRDAIARRTRRIGRRRLDLLAAGYAVGDTFLARCGKRDDERDGEQRTSRFNERYLTYPPPRVPRAKHTTRPERTADRVTRGQAQSLTRN